MRNSRGLHCKGKLSLCAFAVLFPRTVHFRQSFSVSVFSVCSCSNSLVAACRARPSRLCVEMPFYPCDPQSMVQFLWLRLAAPRLLGLLAAILFSSSVAYATDYSVKPLPLRSGRAPVRRSLGAGGRRRRAVGEPLHRPALPFYAVTPSQIVGDRKALHRVNRKSGKTAVQPVGRAKPGRLPHPAHIGNQLCDIVRHRCASVTVRRAFQGAF